jgi:hypothetical protein
MCSARRIATYSWDVLLEFAKKNEDVVAMRAETYEAEVHLERYRKPG